MSHNDIYSIFTKVFPMFADKVSTYFPNGKNSIRVRLNDAEQDFVFTFVNGREWRFETVDVFIKNTLKKENW